MVLGRQQHRPKPTPTSEDPVYTIRRTAIIVAVAAGLAVTSTGLTLVADGGPTGTAPVATTAAGTLALYAAHYNARRLHRALILRPPRPEAPVPEPVYGRIRRRPLLAGLINDYAPAA